MAEKDPTKGVGIVLLPGDLCPTALFQEKLHYSVEAVTDVCITRFGRDDVRHWSQSQPGKIVDGGANVGVVGAQRLLADGKRALGEWLGLQRPRALRAKASHAIAVAYFRMVHAIFPACQSDVALGD